MTGGKIEYLQMIQEPIGRMSTASAIFKGFAATIVSGIAALTYCEVHPTVLALSFVPVLLFAFLDVYYSNFAHGEPGTFPLISPTTYNSENQNFLV